MYIYIDIIYGFKLCQNDVCILPLNLKIPTQNMAKRCGMLRRDTEGYSTDKPNPVPPGYLNG